MGRQRLFLTIISVSLILIIAYIGVNTLKSYSEASNREQIISTLYDIGLSAQKYYKKNHNEFGKNTFTGWVMPLQYEKTEAGTFVPKINNNQINLCANGNETGINGFTHIRVTASVDSSGIRITVIN